MNMSVPFPVDAELTPSCPTLYIHANLMNEKSHSLSLDEVLINIGFP